MARLETGLSARQREEFSVPDGLARLSRWLDVGDIHSDQAGAAAVPAPEALDFPVYGSWQGGPLAARAALGRYLRRLREARRLPVALSADSVQAAIAGAFHGMRGRWGDADVREVDNLLTAYGITSELAREQVLYLAGQCAARPWWDTFAEIIPESMERYLELEEAAAGMQVYGGPGIPDLLQTPGYAIVTRNFALFDEATMALKLLEARQAALTSSCPVRYHAILDEGALLGLPGGTEAARGQIRHILSLSRLGNVTIQVTPHGKPPLYGGPFSIMRMSDPDLPDVACIKDVGWLQHFPRAVDLDAYERQWDRAAEDALTPSQTRLLLQAVLTTRCDQDQARRGPGQPP
jgi:hypothetical protein